MLRVSEMSPTQSLIPLRCHHLVCMQYFVGKGYDNTFIHHMASVIEYLRQRPKDRLIQVVEGTDVICSKCPHRTQDSCTTNNGSILQKDAAYRLLLQLPRGVCLSYAQATEKVQRWITDDVFQKICGSCEWYLLCLSVRARSKSV